MQLAKAIEILQNLSTTLPQYSSEDRRLAVNLGIESLKRQQQLRISRITFFRGPLPGETLE